MTYQNPFKPAHQVKKRLKMLIYGESGVGKTTLALTLPFGGKVALIDMEGGADLYAEAEGIPAFDVVRTKSYQDVMNALSYLNEGKSPYAAVVVDPISVLWSIIVEAGSKSESAVTQREWGVIKRKMNAVYNLLVNLPLHVVVIARAKDEYKNDEKIGMKADAEKGLVFLFDVILRMGLTQDGKRAAEVIKDRSNTFGRVIQDVRADLFAPLLGKVSNGQVNAHQQTDAEASDELANQIANENRPNARPAVIHQSQAAVARAQKWEAVKAKFAELIDSDIPSDVDLSITTDVLNSEFNSPDEADRFLGDLFNEQWSDGHQYAIHKWLDSRDHDQRQATIALWREVSHG